MVVGQNKTYVATLRVRSPARETLSVQLRMKQALASLDLRPPSLPANASVFVRRLHDPSPGSLRLRDGDGVPQAWAQAVAASLDQIVRRAARPALEPVAADAEAVLFADRAELLSCLAADWCDGSAITRWWWQTLFRASDVSSAVLREWLASIEYVPAAFTRLTQRRTAITFASRLAANSVDKLIDEIAGHFGLTELRDARLSSINQGQPRGSPPSYERSASNLKWPSLELLSFSESAELRSRWAPETLSPRLEPRARVLLAVALMLERAPTRLREHGFASRLLRSLETLNSFDVGADDSFPQSPLDEVQPGEFAAGEREIRRPDPAPASSREDQQVDNNRRASPLVRQADSRVQDFEISGGIKTVHNPQPITLAGRELELVSAEIAPESMSPFSATESEPEKRLEADLAPALHLPDEESLELPIEFSLQTRFGGIFYLINAALAMSLYGDFTRPLEPGIELPIWDFLALTGREFAGPQIEFDPLWAMLARLAGRREKEQPGNHFVPPDECRLPPDWLNAFPEHVDLHYWVVEDRLIVRHPFGFTLLDLEIGSASQRHEIRTLVASEITHYRSVAGFTHDRGGSIVLSGNRIERWTRWICEYLRVRLERALGIGPAEDLVTILFARAARVDVSPARIDVFLALSELPVEIRLAGLDRDPGWVPAAGRAIAFHYD